SGTRNKTTALRMEDDGTSAGAPRKESRESGPAPAALALLCNVRELEALALENAQARPELVDLDRGVQRDVVEGLPDPGGWPVHLERIDPGRLPEANLLLDARPAPAP